MEPVIARKTWRTLEPIHGLIYFSPVAAEAYAELGVVGRSGYFASRSAPMGAVTAEVVVATFFNFSPALVRSAMDGVWDKASPSSLVEARLSAAGIALTDILGSDAASSGDVSEAAELARAAALAASEDTVGRPLFAGHVELPWPEDPLLVLWHGQTLLREFRGDAHVAALMTAGLSGIDALVLHAATGEITRAALQSSRAWSDDEWDAAVASLRGRGLVNGDGAFTERGRELRQQVEDRTDQLSVTAYEAIGDDGCERLRQLCRPLSQAIVAGGAFGLR